MGPESGGRESSQGRAEEVQTRAATGSPKGLHWEGLGGGEVPVAEGEAEDRAAGAWLAHPLLNLLDLARRGAQQTFENG